jgi:murein DD-endopeptidase MepM/ murein hydrolase activator NlpD
VAGPPGEKVCACYGDARLQEIRSMRMRRSLLPTICLLAVACDVEEPAAPELHEPEDSPFREIFDGSRQGGNPGFYFLPPLVSKPNPTGTFDPSLEPVVQICEWTGSECVLPLVREFRRGRRSILHHIKVNRGREAYVVFWRTRRDRLDPEKMYRIRVLVQDQELGFADVDVVRRFRELRQVDRDEFVPLLDDWILPIRFRIEKGAVLPTQTTVIPAEGGTAHLPDFGSVSFPAGAFDSPQAVTVSATKSQETQLTFEMSARFLSIGSRVTHELRIRTGEVAAATASEIVVVVPAGFVESLPPGHSFALFAQILQNGGQDLLDNFVRLHPETIDPSANAIHASLPPTAFTDLRSADGTFEAIVVLASALEANSGVASARALAVVPDMCEAALIRSPVEGPLVVTTNNAGEPNRYDPANTHMGTDYVAKDGVNVLAVADGRIEFIGHDVRELDEPDPRSGLMIKGWGRYVILRHDDLNTTLYAHLQETSTFHLEEGMRVFAGALIGRADNTGGSTGSHLHLEYAARGARHIDPDLCRLPPSNVTASIDPFVTGGPFGGFQSRPGTGVQSTITVTFSGPVSSVTVTALDPDFPGNRVEAVSLSGATATQGFGIDNEPGVFTASTVRVTLPDIIQVFLIPGADDYVAYTGLSFTVESANASATIVRGADLRDAERATSWEPVVGADTVPASSEALIRYLQDRGYRSLPYETEVHPSQAEHGARVKAYFNSLLGTSLRAASDTHPRGSAAVMELLEADGRLAGWVVSVKTNLESDGGRGWFWYEVPNAVNSSGPVASGWGVSSCIACHANGHDFVLTDYPGN